MVLVNKMMNIKDVLENENYVIIPDTNVLLNLYRYTQDYTEYSLSCLNAVKDYIVLPATIRYEYGKNCSKMFYNMERRAKNASIEIKKQIDLSSQKIIDSCDVLERLKYPDVEKVKGDLKKALNSVQTVMDDYFCDRRAVSLAEHSWGGVDKLRYVIEYIEKTGHILQEPTYDDVINWSEEGEKRFQNTIPPGFKDENNKKNKGVRKYADLFIWEEILRYAKNSQKNVVFVTDDAKDDWWETADQKRVFHHSLFEEFDKTGQQLIALNSLELYDEISKAFMIQKPDIVDVVLNMTDDDYCASVEEDVFDEIYNRLAYNAIDYIDEETAHIGTEGIDEFEITDHSLKNYERLNRNDSEDMSNFSISYVFRYEIVAEGISYDYWGRDDDTKEIIRSLGTEHVFSGWIDVMVEREADIFADFESDDSFEKCEIIAGELVEINYHDRLEDEYNEEKGIGIICPMCGKPITWENDAGSGFCVDCEGKKE